MPAIVRQGMQREAKFEAIMAIDRSHTIKSEMSYVWKHISKPSNLLWHKSEVPNSSNDPSSLYL